MDSVQDLLNRAEVSSQAKNDAFLNDDILEISLFTFYMNELPTFALKCSHPPLSYPSIPFYRAPWVAKASVSGLHQSIRIPYHNLSLGLAVAQELLLEVVPTLHSP